MKVCIDHQSQHCGQRSGCEEQIEGERDKKPITAPAPTVLPTVGKAKGKSTACAAKVVPTIAKPKPGKPVCFGQCSIMHGQNKWRVTTAENRRYDKGFSFKTPGAWDELVLYCLANK